MKFRRPFFQFFLSFFHRADSAFNHLFTEKGNFLYYLGALPIVLLFVLLITGLFLFIYYNMSVHQSYDSVKYMTESALFGRFIRNLHRYAADAMMFFVLLHLARMLFEEKFQNHRTLAWVSGLIILFFMLMQGITGYILPLDANSRYVMEKTSELLAGLRVFGDTLPRSFSSPALLGKWIMWVIMVMHLVVPLFFVLLIFIHTLRVTRAKLFPPRKVTIAFLVVLSLFTIIFPISMVEKAAAEKMPELLQPDWFFLFFAAVFDTQWSWVAWAGMGTFFLGLLALPWLLKKRKIITAGVIADNCTGCGLCAIDCPYQAMHMVERKSEAGQAIVQAQLPDGTPTEASQAADKFKYIVSINTDLCSGCGVCAGSCAYDAITHVSPGEKHEKIDWTPAKDKWVTVVCQGRAHSLGLEDDGSVLRPYHDTLLHISPCTGKMGVSLTQDIEAAGAKGVIVGACPEGDCWYREGNKWLMDRINIQRKPNFRKISPEFPILGHRFNGRQHASFTREIGRIVAGDGSLVKRVFAFLKPSSWVRSFSTGTIFAAVILWIFYMGAAGRFGQIMANTNYAILRLDFFYQSDKETCDPSMVPANAKEEAVKRMAGLVKLDNLSQEARERILKQAEEGVALKYCSRARRNLDITVDVDGQRVANQLFKPSGLQRDGITYVLLKAPVTPGEHEVHVKVHERDTGSAGRVMEYKEKLEFKGAEVKLLDYEPNQVKFFLRTAPAASGNETNE